MMTDNKRVTNKQILDGLGELRKGLDWFRTNNPDAYMVLLD